MQKKGTSNVQIEINYELIKRVAANVRMKLIMNFAFKIKHSTLKGSASLPITNHQLLTNHQLMRRTQCVSTLKSLKRT